MNNNQRLREYMKAHNLSYQDIARICRVTVPTVDKWLLPESSDKFQEMPDKYLKLFEKKMSRGGWDSNYSVESEKITFLYN